MSSLPLRNQIIRLAQSKPELREQLIPLLKMASTKLDMTVTNSFEGYTSVTVTAKQMTSYLAAVLSDMGLEVDPFGNSRLMVYLDCGAVTSLSIKFYTDECHVDSSNVLGQSARIFSGPGIPERAVNLQVDAKTARRNVEAATLRSMAPLIRFIKHFTSRCAIQQGG